MTRPRPWLQFSTLILLSLAFLAAASYVILIQGAKDSLHKQFFKREETIARAMASNISNFFQTIGNATALRAQLRSFERGDATTVEDMDAFVAQWRDSGLVSGIILTDSFGVVIFNSNVLGSHDVGDSVADRDYFLWAKSQAREGEYFIGTPIVSKLGASKGQVIVPVASPIFKDDAFWGVTVVAVRLKPLTERSFGLMKISENTNVYLIDQEKNLLYSSQGSFRLSEDIKSSINLSLGGQFEEEGHLIAYSPVSLGRQTWSVVVASPIQEILSVSIPFYVRQSILLVFAAITTFVFGVVVSRKRA